MTSLYCERARDPDNCGAGAVNCGEVVTCEKETIFGVLTSTHLPEDLGGMALQGLWYVMRRNWCA